MRPYLGYVIFLQGPKAARSFGEKDAETGGRGDAEIFGKTLLYMIRVLAFRLVCVGLTHPRDYSV